MKKQLTYILYVVFLALLAVVTADVVFYLRMQVETYSLLELTALLRLMGVLDILEKLLIVTMLGVLAFGNQDRSE